MVLIYLAFGLAVTAFVYVGPFACANRWGRKGLVIGGLIWLYIIGTIFVIGSSHPGPPRGFPGIVWFFTWWAA
jgi:hypothetical protein